VEHVTREEGYEAEPMGRERVAFRAKVAAAALLAFCAFSCLLGAAASLTGYAPYAPGPSFVLVCASLLGFVLAAVEGRAASLVAAARDGDR